MGLRALAVVAVVVVARALWRGAWSGLAASALARRTLLEAGAFVRDWVPWVVLVSVYENSLDLVARATSRLYDLQMFRLDEVLFGGHADLAMQKWVTVGRVDFFSLFYDLLYLYTVGVGAALWLLDRAVAFRRYLVAFLVAGYAGYALYLAFPVIGPYDYFDEIYTVSLEGGRDPVREARLRRAGARDPSH